MPGTGWLSNKVLDFYNSLQEIESGSESDANEPDDDNNDDGSDSEVLDEQPDNEGNDGVSDSEVLDEQPDNEGNGNNGASDADSTESESAPESPEKQLGADLNKDLDEEGEKPMLPITRAGYVSDSRLLSNWFWGNY